LSQIAKYFAINRKRSENFLKEYSVELDEGYVRNNQFSARANPVIAAFDGDGLWIL